MLSGMMLIPASMRGSQASVSMSAVTATSALATLSVPSGSTLVSWTLQYREAGSETWLDYATGITATTKAVAGLSSETQYEFRGYNVVLSSATGTVRITTATSVIPPATASIWYGANWDVLANPLDAVRSYRAVILNTTGLQWRTVAPMFNSSSETPGQILGWRVRRSGSATWTSGTTRGQESYTPPVGTGSTYTAQPILADSAALADYVESGDALEIEVVLAAGDHLAGWVGTGSLPSTCIEAWRSDAGQNSIAGDSMTWTPGYTMPWTHLYIETDPVGPKTRKEGFGGDSLVAMTVPILDDPNIYREGYAIKASATAFSAGDGFQLVSFARSTYTPAQIAVCQQILAVELSGKLDKFYGEGWSYNASPTSQGALDDTITATQAALDAWSATGARVGVCFMSPAGAYRNTSEYLPYYTGAVDYWTGRVPVVNLAASIADVEDPTIIDPDYSQDGIHVNAAGSVPHGAAAYAQVKAILTAGGEL